MSRIARDGRIGVMTVARDAGTGYGGAERVAFDFAKRLDSGRFRSYLCVTHAPPAERRERNEAEFRELEELGVTVLRLERQSLVSNAGWARLYQQLVREPIGVLHGHMPRASGPGAVIGRIARTPVIVSHEHTWSFQGRPVRRFIDRNVIARWSDVVLAVSELDRTRMIEIEKMPADRIRVLPNGIEHVPIDGPDIRGELGVPDDVALIGVVGRLFPQKGIDVLIRAIDALKHSYRAPLRCIILGEGPERAKLQALIDDRGLGGEVSLIGHREDVASVVRSLDVAVLPSRYEGSPLTILEYMAGAAPIVATEVGGVPELVVDSEHALLVEPEQPDALAAAIQRLIEDRELARRLGHQARERQLANYSQDAVIRQLEELYLELYEASTQYR